MSDMDTRALAAEHKELAKLMDEARCGRLVPHTWQRLLELKRIIAAAEGAEASDDLTAAADVLRERGHR